jgi:hypothetical protein
MRKLFYFSALALMLYEIANVYFIMPMPGSQQMDSVGLAYALYTWRWPFRVFWGAIALFAFYKSHFSERWKPALAVLLWAFVTCMFNAFVVADKMFLSADLVLKNASESQVDTGRVALCVAINGEAKAYPIQYMAYHHQVQDSVGRQPVMVTYCNVCRTGRVFTPQVMGANEVFRLVGMDHFNAMFEDSRTGSWWRQENGEAITGPLRGQFLPEMPSEQMALGQWLRLYPNSLVMQPDPRFQKDYEDQNDYETGRQKGALTGTDSLSWREKSWVVGVETDGTEKAFDWNELKAQRVLNDQVGEGGVVLALASDDKSFVAFRRPPGWAFSLQNDTLVGTGGRFDLLGRSVTPGVANLQKLTARQDFWHSWRTFHGK